MKSCVVRELNDTILSLPVRGAWIEMLHPRGGCLGAMSLPVRGAWIEMPHPFCTAKTGSRRSPCGERGLKYSCYLENSDAAHVAPRAGSVD